MFLKEQRNLEFNYTNLDIIIREGSCNNKDEEEKMQKSIDVIKDAIKSIK